MKKKRMKETPSKSSPKGGKRGCLCKDNTYSQKCCDGTLRAQGIGKVQTNLEQDFLKKVIGVKANIFQNERKYNFKQSAHFTWYGN